MRHIQDEIPRCMLLIGDLVLVDETKILSSDFGRM